MQFNVAQLLQEVIGETRHYELSEDISDLDPKLKPLGPLVGHVKFMRIPSGILVAGELSTALQVTCNRCLEPIVTTTRFELEESFRPLKEIQTGRYIHPKDFQGTEEDLDDPALIINELNILDISEVVRQMIWLELPMYSNCNWVQSGACPNLTTHLQEIEGIDLNPTDKEDDEIAIDPRWAALLKIADSG